MIKCTRKDLDIRKEVELNGEILKEIKNFKYLKGCIVANERVESNVSSKVDKWCKLLDDMKKLRKIKEYE